MNQPEEDRVGPLTEVLGSVLTQKILSDNNRSAADGAFGVLSSDAYLDAALGLVCALLLTHPEWLAAHARWITEAAFPRGLYNEGMTRILDYIVENAPLPGQSR